MYLHVLSIKQMKGVSENGDKEREGAIGGNRGRELRQPGYLQTFSALISSFQSAFSYLNVSI